MESTDKLTKTITPKAGYKITIETAIYTTDTGTQSRALIISTLPVAADTSTPVPDTVTAGFAPVDGVQPTGQPTQVYTAESAAAAQKQANTTRDTIHDLAHHNTDMISAMNLVIARKYTEAGQVLAKSKIV